MSIGEWINLYSANELDIHPEFQRFYRWKPSQKSRFIESILLGIPIPPIFVSQSERGAWDVVDGLQRLSTIFELVGILKDEKGKAYRPLVLEATKYLPSLEGRIWEDDRTPSKSLDQTQRLVIKRTKLHVNIILRESDEKAKYELFQRLNTGGSPLSDQEMRNCLMVMINKEFYENLREMCSLEDFQNAISLTDKALEEQYDLELALRFVVFRNLKLEELKNIGGDVSDYVTDRMMDLLKKKFDWDKEKRIFKNTFRMTYGALDDGAFKRYDVKKNKFVGGFLLSAFEVIALGIGYNSEKTKLTSKEIIETVKKMWSQKEYTDNSGSGVKAASRLPKLIPIGRKLFK
jgi:hypothetical protein